MNYTVSNNYSKNKLIIGNRGLKGEILENTLESIIHAIDSGVDGILIDVQRCQTGELIVFHDETLDRLAFKDEFYFTKTQNINIKDLQWYHFYNTQLIDTIGRVYKIPQLIDILSCSLDVLIIINVNNIETLETLTLVLNEVIDEGSYTPNNFLIISNNVDVIIYLGEFKEEMETRDQKYENFKIGYLVSPGTPHETIDLISDKSHLKVLTHLILDKIDHNLIFLEELKIFTNTNSTNCDGVIIDKNINRS